MLDAFAQGGPFGVARPTAKPAPPPDGFVGWILAKQAEFSLAMRAMLRNAKADGSAVWGLLGLSFLYGIFHAAGPGHGKAVISSYVVANHETWRRGVVLSFASAFLQAFVAVAFVVIAAWVFNATMATMCTSERYIEIVSYALIALIGLRLVWVKGRAMFNTWRGMSRPLHAVGAAVTPHDHKHGEHHHDHKQTMVMLMDTAMTISTTTAITIITTTVMATTITIITATSTPRPGAMRTARSRRNWPGRAAGGVACRPSSRSGLRPCSGAILVLVFALAQGMLWAGVAATFVMGLGTAITVAAIATVAVGARELAAGSPRRNPATACWRCAASKPPPPSSSWLSVPCC